MDLNRKTLRIRMIEEELSRRYADHEMRCPIHLSLGQEHIAVGVCAAIPKDSLMVSTHRSHAHYLAKGGDLKRMIAELYGKDAGCSRGNGGSMHLVDWDCGFAGSTSIVGGTIPVGVGLAFADRLRGSDRITAIMIGDAAVEEGVFHESANFAALHKLNVLFVVEDNDRSCYTKKTERQPNRRLSQVFDAHNIKTWTRTCVSPTAVARETKIAMKQAFPSAIIFNVYSRVEHCGPKVDNGYMYKDGDYEIEQEIKEAFEYAKNCD